MEQKDKEIYFNMGGDYYELLSKFKARTSEFMLYKEYESAFDVLDAEWSHIRPYMLKEKHKKLREEIDEEIESLRRHFSGKIRYDMSSIIRKLKAVINNMYELEALEKMLQPLDFKKDPLHSRRVID